MKCRGGRSRPPSDLRWHDLVSPAAPNAGVLRPCLCCLQNRRVPMRWQASRPAQRASARCVRKVEVRVAGPWWRHGRNVCKVVAQLRASAFQGRLDRSGPISVSGVGSSLRCVGKVRGTASHRERAGGRRLGERPWSRRLRLVPPGVIGVCHRALASVSTLGALLHRSSCCMYVRGQRLRKYPLRRSMRLYVYPDALGQRLCRYPVLPGWCLLRCPGRPSCEVVHKLRPVCTRRVGRRGLAGGVGPWRRVRLSPTRWRKPRCGVGGGCVRRGGGRALRV